MSKHALVVGMLVIVASAVQSPANLRSEAPTGAAPSGGPAFPDLIPLPTGFGPEGIAVGCGGAIYLRWWLPLVRALRSNVSCQREEAQYAQCCDKQRHLQDAPSRFPFRCQSLNWAEPKSLLIHACC